MTRTGEEVKAKYKKQWTRACARELVQNAMPS